MAINLTAPLFGNVLLEQSWIIAFLNLAAGLIGALIGASAVLWAQKMNLEKNEESSLRKEREGVYTKFTGFLNNWIIYDNFDRNQFTGIISELTLVGNPIIINKIVDIFKHGDIFIRKQEIIDEYYNIIIPLMRRDIRIDIDDKNNQINIAEWLGIKI
jgi:hypothetical protein